MIEYATGRYTRKSPVEAFKELIGPAYRFLGAYIAFNTVATAAYYVVVVGWCLYYFFKSCIDLLPTSETESVDNWNTLQDGHFPILCTFVILLLSSAAVSRGVSTFEPVNLIIVPILLLTLAFSFYWAIFLPYASVGITHLFTPDWESFANMQLWRDAISQNAWDTGAASGIFLTYATYMKRTQGVVKLGLIAPVMNNVISLVCGIMIFACVFSAKIIQKESMYDIIDTLKNSGPANTGLTFIWMPVLYRTVGSEAVGRVLCAVFFLALVLAGVSSLISQLEVGVHILNDFGIKRLPSTIIIFVLTFAVAIGSAVNLDFLINQDAVWSFGLVMSGAFYLVMIFRYGVFRFRRKVVNEYGIGDWKLRLPWALVVIFLCPLVAAGLFIWWVLDAVTVVPEASGVPWYAFTKDSFFTTLSEWLFVLFVLIGLNWWMKPLNIRPRDPSTRFWKFIGFFVQLNAERPEGYRRNPKQISSHVATTPTPSPVAERKETNVVLLSPSGVNEKVQQSLVTSDAGDIPDALLSAEDSIYRQPDTQKLITSEEHSL